jgi:ABC-type antimicrobial peptide transport system permease subunit
MPEILGNVTSAPRIAFVLLDILALVRLTFGAPPNAILYMLVRQATTLTLSGVAAGLLCALLMTILLHGISSTDAATFLGATVPVTIVSTLACYLPARRAVRVDPLVALRSE